MMKLTEELSTRGDVSISLKYEDGRHIPFFEKKNLIVNGAKLILRNSIYISSSTNYIATLKVGKGGTIDPQGLVPKIEDATQTGLITPLTVPVSVPVTSIPGAGAPSDFSVTFLADVDNSQGNGELITEVGLFTTSGSLFSIKNHPAITKTSAFSIHYEWKIRVL